MPKIAAALEKPLGPLPVWGWAIVGVGGIAIFYFVHKGGSSSSSQQTSLVPATSGTPTGADNTAQDPNTLLLDQILAQLQANAPGQGQGTGGGTGSGTGTGNPPSTTPPVIPPITIPPINITIPPVIMPPTPVTPTPGQTTGWLNFGGATVPAGTNFWDRFLPKGPLTNGLSQAQIDAAIKNSGLTDSQGNPLPGVNWNPSVHAYQYVGNAPGSFTPAPITAFQTATDLANADVNNPADVSYIANNYYRGNTTAAIAGITNMNSPEAHAAANAQTAQTQANVAAANAAIYGNPSSPTFTGKAAGTP